MMRFFLGICIGLVVFSGCGTPRVVDSGRLMVAVSIEPLVFLVREIGGDDVDVEVIVPAGRDPESYHPTPQSIARLERSRVVFRLGFPFEATLLPKLSGAARRRVIDLREGQTLHKSAIASHTSRNQEIHRHKNMNMCVSDDGSDNHIWLGPTCLTKMVAAIARELAVQRPDLAHVFTVRAANLTERIEACRQEIAAQLAPFHGETILVFHPAYRYFCDDFGLQQRAIEFEGRSPRPQEIAAWLQAATDSTNGVLPVVIVQPEFSRASAQAIAEAIDAPLAEHSPLQHDVLDSLRKLADIILTAERRKPPLH